MRKVIAHVKDSSSEFDETYVEGERGSFPVGHPDPEEWIKGCVTRWNATLRPGERERVFVSATITEIIDAQAKIEHRWGKTNLVTIDNGRQRLHDTARCSVCGITGKRFGLGDVTRDPRYKAAGYETCNGAIKLLAKRAPMKERE